MAWKDGSNISTITHYVHCVLGNMRVVLQKNRSYLLVAGYYLWGSSLNAKTAKRLCTAVDCSFQKKACSNKSLAVPCRA
jgi:hypothetical protein